MQTFNLIYMDFSRSLCFYLFLDNYASSQIDGKERLFSHLLKRNEKWRDTIKLIKSYAALDIFFCAQYVNKVRDRKGGELWIQNFHPCKAGWLDGLKES